MPPALIPILGMLAGHYGMSAATGILKKLFLGKAAGSLAESAAGAISGAVAKNAAGQAVEKGLAQVAGKLPGWAAKHVSVPSLVGGAAGLIGTGAYMGGFGYATDAATNTLESMLGRGSDKQIDGWERYQGQMNPGGQNQAMAIQAIQQGAEMKHLERALREMLAQRQEDAERIGGLL